MPERHEGDVLAVVMMMVVSMLPHDGIQELLDQALLSPRAQSYGGVSRGGRQEEKNKHL